MAISSLCIRCKGRGLCGQPCEILGKFKKSAPKVGTHFSGSSPPEIFVGRVDYPNVFSGILSPTIKGETGEMASCEDWVKKNLSIEDILGLRGQMVYGRGQEHIKSPRGLRAVMQEIAMASKPVSTEFFLKRKPQFSFTPSKVFSIMTNPAPVEKVLLEENPYVEKKVDYLVGDYDVKAVDALDELYKEKIRTSDLQKLFSAGLLGVKAKRKLVPTRWSITAVDDTLGKFLLEKIRYYPELNEILLFSNYYNGNAFEILVLPGSFEFEVIEVSVPGSVWSMENNKNWCFMQDHEGFFGRKTYAKNVVGAYYADRLGVCEYLEKIKRQATVFMVHEEREEYYAPLGVGIIRESVRKAMAGVPEKFSTLGEALEKMKGRLKSPWEKLAGMGWVLDHYGKQKKISEFF